MSQFRLSSLLLTTALVASCLGIGRIEPWLGTLTAIVSGIAYVRTVMIVWLRCPERPVAVSEKFLWFLHSMVVVTLIGITSMGIAAGTGLASGFVVSVVQGLPDGKGWVGFTHAIYVFLLALFAGLATVVWLMMKLWVPPRDGK